MLSPNALVLLSRSVICSLMNIALDAVPKYFGKFCALDRLEKRTFTC
jgi:hypothetical protein